MVPMVALVGCTVVPSAGSAGLLCWSYWPQFLFESVCLLVLVPVLVSVHLDLFAFLAFV